MSRISTPRRYPSGELAKFDSPSNSTTTSSPWGPLAIQTLPAVRKSSYSHFRKVSRELVENLGLWATTSRTLHKRSSERSLRKSRKRYLRPFNSKLDLLDNNHLTSFDSNLDPPDTDSIYMVEDYIAEPVPNANVNPGNSTSSTTNLHHCTTCLKPIFVDSIFERQYKSALNIVCLGCIDKSTINASRIIKVEPQGVPGDFGSFSSTSSTSSEKRLQNAALQTYFILEHEPDWYERLQRRLRWRWRVTGLLK